MTFLANQQQKAYSSQSKAREKGDVRVSVIALEMGIHEFESGPSKVALKEGVYIYI